LKWKYMYMYYYPKLSYSELMKHLNRLLEKGLVIKRREGNRDIYDSTEKGLLYLKHYKQIKELLSA